MTYSEETGDCTDSAPDSASCPSRSNGYACTRIDGHGGRHEAGTGKRYVATWDDEDEGAWARDEAFR